MELIFNKTNQNVYEAVFEAPADFNLHIERKSTGSLIVKQGISANDEFADATNFGLNAGKIIDCDFGALIYPKFIKVVSGSEVVKAFITCPDGEVNQIIPSKYEFVDLGLPSGTKWATCNVGAIKPEEFGLYFAWGETEGYTADDVNNGMKQFSWADYKLCGGSMNTLTKYNNNSSYGTVDNLTTLEQVDDAAYQSDNTCRTPTRAEIEELIDNTTSTWETLNGVNGIRFTSKTNGNSIFVPAAGMNHNGSINGVGYYCNFWSSSLDKSDSRLAWFANSYLVNMDVNNYDHCAGFSVRAVQDPK